MTTLLLILALSPAFAGDCPKNSDACSGGRKISSPFLTASAAVEKVPGEAAGATPQKSAAAPARTAAPAAAKAPEPAPAGPAAVPPAASAEPLPAAGKCSSPAWLVFIAGGLAGLYFYLSGGGRKGKRK